MTLPMPTLSSLSAKLRKNLAEHGFTDNNGSQADHDSTAAHLDISKALVLAEQRTGECHQTIGEHQAQHNVEISVDALRPRHVGVAAGSADGAAKLGAEEPVQNSDNNHHKNGHDQDGIAVKRNAFDITQGYQQVIFVHVDSLIGFSHDFQIDRI